MRVPFPPLPRSQQPDGAEGAPRLVARFAVVSALCLGLGAAAILLFTRHHHTVQAERTAAARAQLAVRATVAEALAAEDLDALGPARRRQLDRLVTRRVLGDGTLRVTLTHRTRLVYSSDSSPVSESAERIDEALRSTLTSEVTTVPGPVGTGTVKVLRTYVPLSFGGRRAVAAVYQDYRPIEQAARDAFIPVAGILQAVLIGLYVLLVPLLARVSRRIRRQLERIHRQAYYDELTGLPNRPHFREAVGRAVAEARVGDAWASVLLVDLDGFKDVNDALGHETGDGLLAAVSARLREALGDEVLLARLGGDEFGLVVGASPPEAVALAGRVRSLLEEPFILRGVPLAVEASVGISASPKDGNDPERLIQRADVAMYVAKTGRLGVASYDPALDTSSADRLALVSELRRALDEDELELHFQPKARLADGQIVGAEALVRWRHPARGLVMPGEFVPLAERTGLCRPLGRRVLELAVRQLAAWRATGTQVGTLSANLTVFDLDPSLPGEVTELLAHHGVEPSELELEITESTMMADPDGVREVLEGLKRVGVSLAIDDFGTGYSSLAYLQSLPVDVLKIDRSFVIGLADEPGNAAIVASTTQLAHSLGLTVVAEGVETPEAWADLHRFGVDVAQGYLIAKPCPAAEFPTVLARWKRERSLLWAVAEGALPEGIVPSTDPESSVRSAAAGARGAGLRPAGAGAGQWSEVKSS